MANDETGPARLNDSQRRHYEVLFARLERTLIQLQSVARQDDVPASLTIVEPDLPARFTQDAPAIAETHVHGPASLRLRADWAVQSSATLRE